MLKSLSPLLGLLCAATIAHGQWVTQPIPFSNPSTAVAALDAVDSSVAWAVGAQLASEVPVQQFARTVNGGTTWTTGSLTGLTIADQPTGIFALNATTAWVTVVRENQPGQVLHTTDGGATWTVQTTADQFAGPTSYPNFVHFFSATDGLAVGDPDGATPGFEVYTTANAGTTWTRVANVPAEIPQEFGLLTPPAAIGNHLWFGTDENRVYYTPDKGQTWAYGSVNSTELNCIAFRDATTGLALALDEQGTQHQLSRTTDGGRTWNRVAYTGPLHGFGVDNVPGTEQFVSAGVDAGNGDAGSSYSRDNGQSWVALENTVNHFVLDFASATAAWSSRVNGATGAGQGVNKLSSLVLGARAVSPALAGLSVYPNPSPDGHFVVAAQPGQAGAALRVADVLGRVVTQCPWPSSATPFRLDLSAYKAGVYTLEIQSTAGVSRQKLVVE